MAYNITTVIADISSALHGTNTNKITSLNNLFNRSARQLLLDIDPIETERIAVTTTPIWNQVWDYACPADLKGTGIIDISPQYYRTPSDILTQDYQQEFDINKNRLTTSPSFTIQYNTGIKTLRINDSTLPSPTVLDTCSALSTWAAGGSATSLALDNVNWVANAGSLKFNISAGSNPTTGSISITEAGTVDLTASLNQSSLFLYVYFPSVTGITSVELRWGSSASAYYSRTITTTNEGNAFAVGWNLLRADWLGATVVGSPTVTAINYLYVGVTTNGTAVTGINVDNIVTIMGLYRRLRYYSKYLFRDAITGGFQETVTDNSNLINLDTESYNLFFNLVMFYATQQVQGLDAMFFDSNFFGQEYQKGKQIYTSKNKSQLQKPSDQYYTQQQGGFSKYLGRRNF